MVAIGQPGRSGGDGKVKQASDPICHVTVSRTCGWHLQCWYKLSGLKDRIPFVPSVLLEVLALAAAQRLQKLPTHSRCAFVCVCVCVCVRAS